MHPYAAPALSAMHVAWVVYVGHFVFDVAAVLQVKLHVHVVGVPTGVAAGVSVTPST
jgi:hypothetical protein